jgi:hypothetical protein
MKQLDESGVPIPLAERLAPYLHQPVTRDDALAQIFRLDLNKVDGIDDVDRFIISQVKTNQTKTLPYA